DVPPGRAVRPSPPAGRARPAVHRRGPAHPRARARRVPGHGEGGRRPPLVAEGGRPVVSERSGRSGVSAKAYHDAIRDVLERMVAAESAAVERAADLLAGSLADGGVIQAFGTGHSESLAMDLAGRAGGFVPTNKISLHDVVLFGDAEPRILHNEKLERDPQ